MTRRARRLRRMTLRLPLATRPDAGHKRLMHPRVTRMARPSPALASGKARPR